MMPIASAEVLRKIVADEPIYPGSPWKVLGFWRGLKLLARTYLHPWESHRAHVRGWQASVLAKIDEASNV